MYEHPKTSFAATFIGSPPMNLIPAHVKEEESLISLTMGATTVVLPPEKIMQDKQLRKPQVLVGIRPEHIMLGREPDSESLAGTITTVEPLGREALVHVATDCGEILVLSPEKDFKVDETVHVSFELNRIHIFDD